MSSPTPSATPARSRPNLLITGTPGTGKSTLAQRLAKDSGLRWLNVGELASEQGCLGEYDEVLECHELDEDPLLDAMEPLVATGGLIVDHHMTDFFPERYFDIVFVLRTDNDRLHDRLRARAYNAEKLQNNLESEIFQTILDEARASYRPEIVHELTSNSEADVVANLQRIQTWIKQWQMDNKKTEKGSS
eukprot:snap_masked-scaffold19_size710362-processed-gene-4.6 protein:Tk00404 transcript:snap_masked-scaffold19_size710362-processed-gene-4.6-mRNA-1 annotation:"adenylate kinase isoenzyme 6"